MLESESSGVSETVDDGVMDAAEVDAADVHSDEMVEVDVTMPESQQSLTGDADNIQLVEPVQLLEKDSTEDVADVHEDVSMADLHERGASKDVAEVVEVERGENKDKECSSADVIVDGDSDTGHELQLEISSHENAPRNDVQSRQDDKALVEDSEVKSEETEPGVCVNSSEDQTAEDSVNTAHRIDWDAFEKPKQKSSDVENVEFSQVFNKVVKQRSAADGKDLLHQKSEDSGKTEHEAGKAKQLSSSRTDMSVDSGKSAISADEQIEGVEQPEAVVSKKSDVSSSNTSMSPPGKDSSVMSKTNREDDDTRLNNDDSSVKVDTEPHGEGTKPLSSSKEALAVTSCDKYANPPSTGKKSPIARAKPQIKDTKPFSGNESSATTKSEETRPLAPGKGSPPVTKSKPQTKDTRTLSPGIESPAITKSEETKPLAPGKGSPPVTKSKPQTKDTRTLSPGKESPAITTIKSQSEDARPAPGDRYENTRPSPPGKAPPPLAKAKPQSSKDISIKLLGEDVSDDSVTKSASDPQSDKKSVSPDQSKKKESFSTHKANAGDSSSNIASSESDADTTVTRSVSSDHHEATTRSPSPPAAKSSSVKKDSQTNARDQPATIPSVTDCSDSIPCDPVSAPAIVADDRPSGEHEATTAAESNSTSMSQVEQQVPAGGQDQSTTAAGPVSKTSADARAVASQQKKVVQRRTAAKVQPSESKNEEPAWILAAKRKSDQWSEDKAEEFDRKPQKAAEDVDDEVSCSCLWSDFVVRLRISCILSLFHLISFYVIS